SVGKRPSRSTLAAAGAATSWAIRRTASVSSWTSAARSGFAAFGRTFSIFCLTPLGPVSLTEAAMLVVNERGRSADPVSNGAARQGRRRKLFQRAGDAADALEDPALEQPIGELHVEGALEREHHVDARVRRHPCLVEIAVVGQRVDVDGESTVL